MYFDWGEEGGARTNWWGQRVSQDGRCGQLAESKIRGSGAGAAEPRVRSAVIITLLIQAVAKKRKKENCKMQLNSWVIFECRLVCSATRRHDIIWCILPFREPQYVQKCVIRHTTIAMMMMMIFNTVKFILIKKMSSFLSLVIPGNCNDDNSERFGKYFKKVTCKRALCG